MLRQRHFYTRRRGHDTRHTCMCGTPEAAVLNAPGGTSTPPSSSAGAVAWHLCNRLSSPTVERRTALQLLLGSAATTAVAC